MPSVSGIQFSLALKATLLEKDARNCEDKDHGSLNHGPILFDQQSTVDECNDRKWSLPLSFSKKTKKAILSELDVADFLF
ncbi:hypothetical protein AHAS_Ahas02G0229100 [Arachis hypogaea]